MLTLHVFAFFLEKNMEYTRLSLLLESRSSACHIIEYFLILQDFALINVNPERGFS